MHAHTYTGIHKPAQSCRHVQTHAQLAQSKLTALSRARAQAIMHAGARTTCRGASGQQSSRKVSVNLLIKAIEQGAAPLLTFSQ